MTRIYRPANPRSLAWLWVLLGTAVLGLLAAGWGVSQAFWGARNLRYELTPQELVITFADRHVRVERSAVSGMEEITLTGATRLFGTGLPGLQEGRWSYKETGATKTYTTLTHTQPVLVLRTSPEPYVISPADMAGFRRAWETGGSGQFVPVPSRAAAGTAVGVGLIGLLTVFLLVLFDAIVRAPVRMAYELGDEALTLRIRWLSKARIPLSTIRSVRLESPAGHPSRAWGADAPGLYWGSFTWRQLGGNVRLYATQLKPLIVITTDSRTYGISPAEAEEFLADLTQRLG